jgi:hypothetical protein
MHLDDLLVWPILANAFFPKLRWLVITVVGFEDHSDYSTIPLDGSIVYTGSVLEDSSESGSDNETETEGVIILGARELFEFKVRKAQARYHWPQLEYLQLYPLHSHSAKFLTQSTFDVLDTLDISYRWPNEFMRSTMKRMMVLHPRVPHPWVEDKNEQLRMPMIRKVVGRTTGMKHLGLLGALNRPLGEEDDQPQPRDRSEAAPGLKEIDVLIDKSSPEACSWAGVDVNRINPRIFMHLERITFRFNHYEAPASREIDITYLSSSRRNGTITSTHLSLVI